MGADARFSAGNVVTLRAVEIKNIWRMNKRFWIFEAMMLLCGILTVCVEALNYGISLFYLIGH